VRYRLGKVFLLLTSLWTVVGCGNSGEPYVFTGASQVQGRAIGANEVLLSVTAPAPISGAQLRGHSNSTSTLSLRTVQRTEVLQNGDYTLPGALCRAYDVLGQAVATVVILQDGTVRFDTLPSGVYRFVVTNHDAAVVLEVIASASPSGPTLVNADSTSTAAVLVTLAAGKGNFDLSTYSHALAADLGELIGLLEAQMANPGDPWVTSDGKTVVDPAVKAAVEAAVASLPGKGGKVRSADRNAPGSSLPTGLPRSHPGQTTGGGEQGSTSTASAPAATEASLDVTSGGQETPELPDLLGNEEPLQPEPTPHPNSSLLDSPAVESVPAFPPQP
jgi:hypothetical protein